jgi:hypothetical protein
MNKLGLDNAFEMFLERALEVKQTQKMSTTHPAVYLVTVPAPGQSYALQINVWRWLARLEMRASVAEGEYLGSPQKLINLVAILEKQLRGNASFVISEAKDSHYKIEAVSKFAFSRTLGGDEEATGSALAIIGQMVRALTQCAHLAITYNEDQQLARMFRASAKELIAANNHPVQISESLAERARDILTARHQSSFPEAPMVYDLEEAGQHQIGPYTATLFGAITSLDDEHYLYLMLVNNSSEQAVLITGAKETSAGVILELFDSDGRTKVAEGKNLSIFEQFEAKSLAAATQKLKIKSAENSRAY